MRPWSSRLVTAWLTRRVPAALLPGVLGDLHQEFQDQVRAGNRLRAEVWMLREAASTAAAFAPHSRRTVTGLVGHIGRESVTGLREGFRRLRRAPGYAGVTTLSLAIGLASVVATAGLSDAILNRPINRDTPDQIRRLTSRLAGGSVSLRFSFPELDLIGQHLSDTAAVSAAALTPALMRVGTSTTQELLDVVTGPHLEALGQRAILGRLLTHEDDRPGAPKVVVISEPFWRTHFSADTGVLGQTMFVNAAAYTVVGVAPAVPSLGFFGTSAAGWAPAATADSLLNANWRTDADDRAFVALLDLTGRDALTGRAPESRLDAALVRASSALSETFPDRWQNVDAERRLESADGLMVTGSLRSTASVIFTLLAGMAVLILVVAAGNVGGLVFAQWSARRQSTAIRTALGADRITIVIHMLMEGALVGTLSGFVALLLYAWFAGVAREIALLPTVALQIDLPLDASLVALTAGISIAAGMLMTLGPALASVRATVGGLGRKFGDGATSRSRRLLLGVQLAASLVLIVLAALFSRSLEALQDVPLGVDVDHIAAFDFDIAPLTVPAESQEALLAQALERVRALPTVSAAALASRAPVDASTPAGDIRFPNAAGETRVPDVTQLEVTSGYFEAVGVPLLTGRAFLASDAGRDVAIVNETLAQRLESAGQFLDDTSGRRLTVIGVARNSRYRSITEPPQPHFYVPVAPQFHLAMIVRTPGDPRFLFTDVQRVLDDVGPGVQGFFPRTGRDQLEPDLLTTSTAVTMARVLGGIAVLLAVIGLAGVLLSLVQSRRQELGLRLALGANQASVRRLVFLDALRSTWPGVAGGVAIACLAGWALRDQWFGVTPLDPLVLVAVPVTQLVIVLLASWIPARRAARISPVELLR